MKAKWMIVVALGLQTWTSMAYAGGVTASASMEVGIRIVESCAIQSPQTSQGQSAQVSCDHGSPYLVSSGAQSRAATPAPVTERHEATEAAPAMITVAF